MIYKLNHHFFFISIYKINQTFLNNSKETLPTWHPIVKEVWQIQNKAKTGNDCIQEKNISIPNPLGLPSVKLSIYSLSKSTVF